MKYYYLMNNLYKSSLLKQINLNLIIFINKLLIK